MLRVITNKRIDLTDDEWIMFQKICDSYKSYGGEVLFEDLFETDRNGLIQFLKPPSKRQTSLEIFLFLVSVFNHQHIRAMEDQANLLFKDLREKQAQTDALFLELKNKIAALDSKV